MSTKNAPFPKNFDASTMPLDSHAPAFALVVLASTSVGPSSADWLTRATTNGAPPLFRS